MIIRLIMAASLAVTLVSSTAVGETSRYARFQLFSGCGPMRLVVGELHKAAQKLGLARESIQAAAESRLRAARLYSTEAEPYLRIQAAVGKTAFSVRLEFKKWVSDPLSGERIPAATWNTGSFGTHGGDSGYILSTISEHLDEFLVEFLRVNEEACGKR